MPRKKLISFITLGLGIFLLAIGFYYKHKLDQAKKGVDTLFSPLSDNPFGSLVGMDAKGKIKKYEIKIHLVLAAGAILTAAGASYYVYLKQKRRS